MIISVLPNLSAGGAERVGIMLLNRAAEKSEKITLITLDNKLHLKHLLHKNIHHIQINSWFKLFKILKLAIRLKALSPKVVFTTHSRICLLMAFLRIALRMNYFLVSRMQNTSSMEIQYGEWSKFKQTLYQKGFQSSDLIIAQTEDMKKDAIKTLNINPENIKVSKNPVDVNYIKSLANERVPEFNSNFFNIVASGRLHKQKGFKYLIEAISYLKSDLPNIRLYLIGENKGSGESLQKLVTKLDLNDSVFFLGYQSNPYKYYYNCNLFVLSSLWEGFPNVILENYILNTPIVSTACVPEINNLIINGKNGFIVDKQSSISLKTGIFMAHKSLNRKNIKNNYFGDESFCLSRCKQ